MTDTKDRLTRLSPEKRALLMERLTKSRDAAPPARGGVSAIPIDRQNRFEPFPLTDLQQAYWVGRSGGFEMSDVASHSYLEFESRGVDLERLNAAWRRLIDRHEILRTIILADGQQQILETVPAYNIRVLDFQGTDDEMTERELNGIREELSHQVLPTDRWPLFDLRAARLKQDRVRLFASFDALILDAWSMALLFREWSQIYRNPLVTLPALELSFRDYVLAEQRLKKTEDYQRAREYWLKRIPTLPPAPELPQAKAPNAVTKTRFVRRTARLEPEVWSRLKARAAQAHLTPTGVLMAAYVDVLSLWSRSQRFSVNVPRFNRLPLHPQSNDVAGEFASFTVLEVDNTRPERFEERARRWQEQLWQDLNYSVFSGVEVLRELAQAQGRAGGSLMPVVFTSIAQDAREIDPARPLDPAVPGELVFAINQTSQVWLDNHVTEKAGALCCDWDSVDEIFPDGVPQDMLDAYFTHLRGLASDEQFWKATWTEISSRFIPARQMEERTRINSYRAAIPDLLAHQLFEQQAAKRPEHPALISADRSFSYEELDRASNRLGRKLRALGAQPNRTVAVVMEKGWEQVVAVLAILKSGAAYLPIDAEVPAERLAYFLQHSEADVILTQSHLNARLKWPADLRRICLDEDLAAEQDEGALDPIQKLSDLMYVLYTSGSTGVPKGVMIGHRGVVNCLVQTNAMFHIGPEDRVLALTALHHDMSVFDIFGMLAAGGTIVMPQAGGRRDPAHWSELMRQRGVTLWNSVPAMMEMLLEYADDRPGSIPRSLRLAFLGGDWIPLTTPRRLKALAENAQVVSVGGPTETTLWNIWYAVERVDPTWKSIPYGRPIANTKYYVLNEALEPCPTWVTGELCCAGVGLAKGYWRDEEKTNAKFLIHPVTGERIYRTGDLGRYHPDGNIEFIGRADFQVKIQGQRIELGEIESALQQHSSVRSAVVAAVGEAHGKRRLVAYVVPADAKANVNGELREFLEQKLPPHMVPSAFVKLRELPLTANGKVNRLALPAPEEVVTEAPAPDAKKNGLAAKISQLVKKVLDLPEIDPGANLITYGANSIDMVRIGNQLEKEFGFRPRMDQLFRLQTIDALARYYEQHRQEKKLSPEVMDTAGEPDTKAIIGSYRVMLDPAERDTFKKSQPGLRRDDEGKPFIELVKPALDEATVRKYRERCSHRKFSLKPIALPQFSQFLTCLRQVMVDGKPKYLYASPGGLYPGQIYLHVKPGRVEGVGAGTYYYHPVEHRLVTLTPNVDLDRNIHIPFVNTPIFDEAAFSIFEIVALRAIAPSYGEKSIHFATLEAGLIAHLLETSARECGLGLCQIGSIDFERIRPLFKLDRDHVLIHSLLGGLISPEGLDEASLGRPDEKTASRAAAILAKIKQLSKQDVKTLLEANKTVRQESKGN